MQHGFITAWAEHKVMDDGGDAKFIGTEHKSYGYSDKLMERSFA